MRDLCKRRREKGSGPCNLLTTERSRGSPWACCASGVTLSYRSWSSFLSNYSCFKACLRWSLLEQSSLLNPNILSWSVEKKMELVGKIVWQGECHVLCFVEGNGLQIVKKPTGGCPALSAGERLRREGGVSVFAKAWLGWKKQLFRKKVKPKRLSIPLLFPQVPSPPFSSLPLPPPLSLSVYHTYTLNKQIIQKQSFGNSNKGRIIGGFGHFTHWIVEEKEGNEKEY